MIRCLLCGLPFRVVTWSHLKYAHSITVEEYEGMFPEASRVSEETARLRSELHSGRVDSEETRRLKSEARLGHSMSEETRRLLSEALVGLRRSEETRRLMSESQLGKTSSEETCRRQSESLLGHEVSVESRRLISEAQKRLWKDPEYVRRVVGSLNRKPNNSELQLQSILDKHFPKEWEYVGDGKGDENWFEGRNPDFLHVNGKKQVIEMFGVYWHDPVLFPNRMSEEELIAHYKRLGIDCLVLWECDIWDEEVVVERVASFIKIRKGGTTQWSPRKCL